MHAHVAVAAAAFLTAAATGAAAQDCAALAGREISASASTLPIPGGVVHSAEPAVAGGKIFCRVIGELRPASMMGWPIRFQVNLPAEWNRRAVQYGGGGSNGVLVTGEGNLSGSPANAPPPLQQGYVTFGTDAGHPLFRPDAHVFAFNDEATINQAYAAYKKVHDVAVHLVSQHYGARPDRMYFVGGSEGGREALLAVQRYPQDYDGAIAVVPAFNWAAQHLGHYKEWEASQDGGWTPPAKLKLLQDAVWTACDGLDGLRDGVIGQYERCGDVFDPGSLRCADGVDAEGCLSDSQLAFVRTMYSRKQFSITLAHGYSGYAGTPYGAEASPRGGVIGSIITQEPPKPGDLGRPLAGPGSVRHFFAGDPGFSGPFDERKYEARISQLSQLFDATDPDLRPFLARGGRLIVRESAADYLRTPGGSYDYYRAVVQALGQTAADSVMRLYVAPGLGHGGTGVLADGSVAPSRTDLFATLVDWVERGKAPGDLTLTSDEQSASSRPLCRYPAYPHYNGRGDPKVAASFTCRTQEP